MATVLYGLNPGVQTRPQMQQLILGIVPAFPQTASGYAVFPSTTAAIISFFLQFIIP